MSKHLSAAATLGALTALSAAASAQDVARVISSTAVTQQVGVPRTACATYAAPGVPPQCSTQTIYENRTVAYNVIYEYASKQYSVQMPQNPGPTLRLSAAGVQVAGTPVPAPMAAANPVSGPNVIIEDSAMTGEAAGFTQPYPPPVQVTYAYPGYVSYYGSPYYSSWGPVVGVGVGLGLVGGYYYGGGRYHGGHGGHGHRR